MIFQALSDEPFPEGGVVLLGHSLRVIPFGYPFIPYSPSPRDTFLEI